MSLKNGFKVMWWGWATSEHWGIINDKWGLQKGKDVQSQRERTFGVFCCYLCPPQGRLYSLDKDILSIGAFHVLIMKIWCKQVPLGNTQMYASMLFCWIIVCTRMLSRINIERHISYLSDELLLFQTLSLRQKTHFTSIWIRLFSSS